MDGHARGKLGAPEAAEDPAPRLAFGQLGMTSALSLDGDSASVLAHLGGDAEAFGRAEATRGGHLGAESCLFRVARHA